MNLPRRRTASRVLIVIAQLLLALILATSPVAPAGHSSAQDGQQETATAPSEPATDEPAPWPEGVVLGEPYDSPELSEPPAEEEATWVDPDNPAWVVQYGSQAGRQMFAPQPAPPQFQTIGPSVDLGYSRIFDLDAGDVRGIAGSPDGRLFVALGADGLRVYVPFSAGGYRWSIVHAGSGLASDHVTALAAFGDEIWVGTSDAGISILDTRTNAWRTLNTGNSPLPSNYINRIRAFRETFPFHASLWVATDHGAAGYEWVGSLLTGQYEWTHVFTPANSPLVTSVNDITVQVAAHAYVWFAASASSQRWDSSANSWAAVSSISPSANCIFDGATAAATDQQGRVWLAVHVNTPAAADVDAAGRLYTGVCRYDGSGWKRYRAAPQEPGLPGDRVTDFTVDPAGRVWLSMDSAGGAVFDPQGCSGDGSWQMYTGSALLNGNVTRVQAVGDMVWFGHRDNAGLTGYSFNWKQFTTAQMGGLAGNTGPIYLAPSSAFVGVGASYAYSTGSSWSTWTPPGNTAAVSAFAITAGSPLFYTEWIGTAGNGLYAWHLNTFSRLSTADGLPGNTIQALVIDRAGRLWVGTSQGLGLQAGSYWLAFHSTDSALTNNNVSALAVDGTGRVWIGTRGGGITIYDEAITGSGKWTTQRVADGLPSDMVNGLAVAPDGSVWAATEAGVGVWQPASGAWTRYAGVSALPSDNVLSIAVDPLGRVWAGTAAGLARREAGAWQAFHISGSSLTNERVSAVAADSERVWAGSGTTALAVRGLVTGPIGLCAPAITDFTPKQGPVGTLVTISGHDFDDRGVAYNKVLFGVGNPYATAVQGEIQSASATSIVVKAPALAATGRLVVQANGLTSNNSAQDFTVTPGFGLIIPACVAAGDPLTIYVNGLTGSSQTVYVKIGPGDWHPADYRDPTLIRQIVRANDASGAVSLRIGYDGPIYTGPGVSVAQPQVVDWRIQQEVQPYPHIFGKRTLVQVRMNSSSAMCNARVRGGYMDWKLTTNETRPAAFAPYFASPGLLNIPATAPAYSLSTVANFVGIYGLVPPNEITLEDPRFPLSQFNGVDLALTNNGVTLVWLHLPPAAFDYHTFAKKKFINFAIGPGMTPTEWDEYVRVGLEGMLLGAARIYPQRDDRLAVMPGLGSAWIYWPPADGIGWTDYINLAGDNCSEVQEHAQDLFDTWNDPHHENGTLHNGAGIIAEQLTDGNTHMGCSHPGEWAVVAVNNDGRVGKTMMHEVFHTDYQVSKSAPNYDNYNPAQGHSAYDGGVIHPNGGAYACNNDLTFASELRYAYGSAQTIIGLYGSTPVDYSVAGCGRNAAQDIMSYADNRFNENTFPDPWLYQTLWGEWLGYASADAEAGQAEEAAVGASRVLYLNGNINQAGVVTPTMSYLTEPGSDFSTPDPAGAYRLQFRSTSNQLLRGFPFDVSWQTNDGDPISVAHFSLHVRFPDATSQVQIRRSGQLLWSKTISAHAPTVAFTSPNGGSYNAAGTVPVSWTANDQDGNPLKFEVDYSPDGTNWTPLVVSLTGASFQWKPGFVPASTAARLRVTASDGFLTGQADSALFTLTARPPLAYITAPQQGQTFLEGAAITLEGGAVTSDGAGSYQWLRGATQIGVLPTITTTLTSVGSQTFTLRVTSGAGVASTSVTINVIADYDRDGMPNAWELQYRLDALDPTDAPGDADGDGLNNLREYQLGTNPRLADTDGDGAGDGAEITALTDPLRADSKPPTQATLYVGSGDLTFTWRRGTPLPDATTFYVRGAGGRMRVNWSATSSASWLKIAPASGTAPTQVSISVAPGALAAGNYHGKITFTAAAIGSPYEVNVTLKVLPSVAGPVYLPLLVKHTRR